MNYSFWIWLRKELDVGSSIFIWVCRVNYENGFEFEVIINEIKLMVWKWLLKLYWFWNDSCHALIFTLAFISSIHHTFLICVGLKHDSSDLSTKWWELGFSMIVFLRGFCQGRLARCVVFVVRVCSFLLHYWASNHCAFKVDVYF